MNVKANAKPIPTRESLGLLKREPPVPAPVDGYETVPKEPPICDSSAWHRPGNVVLFERVEYGCERVTSSSAVFRRMGKKAVTRTTFATGKAVEFEVRNSEIVRLAPTTEGDQVLRRMSREEYQDFVARKSPRAAESKQQQTKSEGDEERTVTDMAKKSKAVKKTGASMAGSSQMVRDLCSQGVSKIETFKRVTAKYPHFADGNDAAGLESRWAMAEAIVKNAKAAAKSGKKAAKASRTAPSRPLPPPPVRPAATEAAPAAPAPAPEPAAPAARG